MRGDTATVAPDYTGRRDPFSLVKGEPTDTIVVTWQYDTRNTHGTRPRGVNDPYTAADAADDAGGVNRARPTLYALGALGWRGTKRAPTRNGAAATATAPA